MNTLTKRSVYEKVVQSQKYGAITYEENFWSGAKSISIEGERLPRSTKNTFTYTKDGEYVPVVVNGSYKTGCTVKVGDETIVVYDKIKWYEILMLVITLVVPLVWGNVPALCAIFPVLGGALGAVVGVLIGFLGLLAIRAVSNGVLKACIFIGVIALDVGVLYGVEQLFLMAIAQVA